MTRRTDPFSGAESSLSCACAPFKLTYPDARRTPNRVGSPAVLPQATQVQPRPDSHMAYPHTRSKGMGSISRILLVASITGSLLSCGWSLVGPLQRHWTALCLAIGFLAATLAAAGLLRLDRRRHQYAPQPRPSARRRRCSPTTPSHHTSPTRRDPDTLDISPREKGPVKTA